MSTWDTEAEATQADTRAAHKHMCISRYRCQISSTSYLPCLLVAEFLRYHFPQLQPQPISHFLGQVVVRAPAKKHDVRHGRCSLLQTTESKIRGGEMWRVAPLEGLWKLRGGGRSLLMQQPRHCTGAALGRVGGEEISGQCLHGKRKCPPLIGRRSSPLTHVHSTPLLCYLPNTSRPHSCIHWDYNSITPHGKCDFVLRSWYFILFYQMMLCSYLILLHKQL